MHTVAMSTGPLGIVEQLASGVNRIRPVIYYGGENFQYMFHPQWDYLVQSDTTADAHFKHAALSERGGLYVVAHKSANPDVVYWTPVLVDSMKGVTNTHWFAAGGIGSQSGMTEGDSRNQRWPSALDPHGLEIVEQGSQLGGWQERVNAYQGYWSRSANSSNLGDAIVTYSDSGLTEFHLYPSGPVSAHGAAIGYITGEYNTEIGKGGVAVMLPMDAEHINVAPNPMSVNSVIGSGTTFDPAGVVGKSAYFDGNGAILLVEDGTNIMDDFVIGPNGGTLEFWFKGEGGQACDPFLIYGRNQAQDVYLQVQVLDNSDGDKLYFYLEDTDDSAIRTVTLDEDVLDNEWHHFAVVVHEGGWPTGPTGLALYVDGICDTTLGVPNNDSVFDSLAVGNSPTLQKNCCHIYVDEVYITNRTKYEYEIRKVVARGKDGLRYNIDPNDALDSPMVAAIDVSPNSPYRLSASTDSVTVFSPHRIPIARYGGGPGDIVDVALEVLPGQFSPSLYILTDEVLTVMRPNPAFTVYGWEDKNSTIAPRKIVGTASQLIGSFDTRGATFNYMRVGYNEDGGMKWHNTPRYYQNYGSDRLIFEARAKPDQGFEYGSCGSDSWVFDPDTLWAYRVGEMMISRRLDFWSGWFCYSGGGHRVAEFVLDDPGIYLFDTSAFTRNDGDGWKYHTGGERHLVSVGPDEVASGAPIGWKWMEIADDDHSFLAGWGGVYWDTTACVTPNWQAIKMWMSYRGQARATLVIRYLQGWPHMVN